MKKQYILAIIIVCLAAWFAITILPNYLPGSTKYYTTLEKEGVYFTGPHFVIYGKKDRDMKLTIWTRYATMSDNCRGAHIVDSDRVTEFSPGSPRAKSMGVAMRLITIPRGVTNYEISIPQNIEGPWGEGQCNWDNFETEIYMNNRYTGRAEHKKMTSLFLLFPLEPKNASLQSYYRLLCKNFYIDRPKEELYGDGQLVLCRYPGQKAGYAFIDISYVKQGATARIDFVMSEQESQPFYPDAQRDFFNKKKGNAADWDYFLTDEEFLAQERQVKE